MAGVIAIFHDIIFKNLSRALFEFNLGSFKSFDRRDSFWLNREKAIRVIFRPQDITTATFQSNSSFSRKAISFSSKPERTKKLCTKECSMQIKVYSLLLHMFSDNMVQQIKRTNCSPCGYLIDLVRTAKFWFDVVGKLRIGRKISSVLLTHNLKG